MLHPQANNVGLQTVCSCQTANIVMHVNILEVPRIRAPRQSPVDLKRGRLRRKGSCGRFSEPRDPAQRINMNPVGHLRNMIGSRVFKFATIWRMMRASKVIYSIRTIIQKAIILGVRIGWGRLSI